MQTVCKKYPSVDNNRFTPYRASQSVGAKDQRRNLDLFSGVFGDETGDAGWGYWRGVSQLLPTSQGVSGGAL